MSQPKHLWSGDWEHESQGPPTPPVAEPPAPEPPPAYPPAARDLGPAELASSAGDSGPPPFIPRQWERGIITAAIALVVIAGAIWGVTAIANRGGGANVTDPAFQTGASPQGSTAHADGLGLVLESVGTDQVVITGVVPGSAATAIGIGPGLQLLSVNGQQVTSAAQADGIIRGLKLGTAVTMQLAQGGAEVTAQIQEPGVP